MKKPNTTPTPRDVRKTPGPEPTAWAHLPNAALIDHILDHLRKHPQRWDAAWDAARDAAWGAAWGAARGAAWDAARDVVWDAVRDAAWGAARGAAWDVARDAARDEACDAAWGALSALIAWDNSCDFLKLPPDALHTLDACGNPQAILLLPAAIALKGEMP